MVFNGDYLYEDSNQGTKSETARFRRFIDTKGIELEISRDNWSIIHFAKFDLIKTSTGYERRNKSKL